MTPRYRAIPQVVVDTTVDTARRRHVLYGWYRAEIRRAARPRVWAMVVHVDGGRWYSSPGRPLLAGPLLAYATAAKTPSPTGPEIEPAARTRWARAIRRGVNPAVAEWLDADAEAVS